MNETLEIELYFLFMIEASCDMFEEKIEFLNENSGNRILFYAICKKQIKEFYNFYIQNAHQINILPLIKE